MNIVLIGNSKNKFTLTILREFLKLNIDVKACIFIDQGYKYNLNLFKTVLKEIGFYGTIISTFIRFKNQMLQQSFKSLEKQIDFKSNNVEKLKVKGASSVQMQELLESLQVDLLVLGNTGIIKNNILTIPSIGTLNVHPGILPQYKGLDSIYWASYLKDFKNIGVTVHFVDEGIDTGNIISKTYVNFENEKNISKAYRNLLRLSTKVLADAAIEITDNRNIKTISNEDGNYYSKIPIKKYFKAKKYFKYNGEK
tara:strand:- start:9324 stop:10082 length:759 start_codon:yes stop_codon:yes gene_type:complete